MKKKILEKYNLCESKIPRHIAIIMDGNGRWAKKNLWKRIKGHYEGAKTVDVITSFCAKIGVENLTLYAFSTENWKRPEKEIAGLMGLLREYLDSKKEVMLKNKIKFRILGDYSVFPEDIRNKIEATVNETASQDTIMSLNLALNYGGRTEIIKAVKEIAQAAKKGEVDPDKIDENMIGQHLYSKGIPDPDLVIRTSGEIRLSNYLIWQTAYSELYFTDILWPDFREKEFAQALKDFENRERRFGKTGDQLKIGEKK